MQIEKGTILWYALFTGQLINGMTTCDNFRYTYDKEATNLETLSLLIADSSEEFRSALVNALQEEYRIQTCRTGKEALNLLRQNKPDIMIMDLMLPELDGIGLLQAMDANGVHPIVLATTRLANDYVVDATTKLGVEYLMIKPCDAQVIASRVRDLSRKRPRPQNSAPDARTHVSNLLTTLGISTKLRGYSYMREAVLYMIANPLQSITKELYPRVARKFECNSAQVERSIRNAIQGAWNQRDEGVWSLLFQPDATGHVPRPSNAAFITRLADRVNLDQMEFSLDK